MQSISTLLFLLLLFGGCNSSQHPPPPPTPIELTFNELSAEDMELLLQNFEINDTLKPWYMEIGYLRMLVKNNNYDLLCLSLSKIGKSLVYQSDVIDKYQIENDSLRRIGRNIQCFFHADSVICLKKGQSSTVYFGGRCADGNSVYVYNFSFYADSAGQEINPEFMRFPCGNDLPKKKGY